MCQRWVWWADFPTGVWTFSWPITQLSSWDVRGPLGAARLAVIQCAIHMRLSVRAWCIHFPSLLTRTLLLHRLRALRCSVLRRMRCHSLTSTTKRRPLKRLIHLISRERFLPCLLRSISHVFHPPSLSPPWQWLMSLSCLCASSLTLPSFFFSSLHKKKDKSGRI